jgi:hypothetical protein
VIHTYNPIERNDPRFTGIRARFPGIQILFVSGMTGWCWSAKLPSGDECGESCFLSTESAMDNCLEMLNGEPVFKPSPFATTPELKKGELEDYLSKWTASHG